MNDFEKRYEVLKKIIVVRTETEIKSQIEIAKALYEIKEKQLYLYDNFKNFSQFLKQYNKTRTQAYRYISVVHGIVNGMIQEQEVLDRGFKFVEGKLLDTKKPEIIKRKQFLLSFPLNRINNQKKAQ